MNLTPEANDALMAAVELVQRSGARQFEVGFLREDVPADEAGWWATATYRGAKLQVDEQPSPVHAADELARRILAGGECTLCRLTVTTTQELTDAAALGLGPAEDRCVWARHGRHWIAGCADPAAEATRLESAATRSQPGQPLNREQRRRARAAR